MIDSNLTEIELQLLSAYRDKQWERGRRIIDLGQKEDDVAREKAELDKKEIAIKEEYAVLNGHPQTKPFKGRRARLPVTTGAIDHKYLLVTRALSDGVLDRKETLKISVPVTGRIFETTVYFRNKILNERFCIGEFYRTAGIQPGDFVLLEEVAAGQWTLAKCDGPS